MDVEAAHPLFPFLATALAGVIVPQASHLAHALSSLECIHKSITAVAIIGPLLPLCLVWANYVCLFLAGEADNPLQDGLCGVFASQNNCQLLVSDAETLAQFVARGTKDTQFLDFFVAYVDKGLVHTFNHSIRAKIASERFIVL